MLMATVMTPWPDTTFIRFKNPYYIEKKAMARYNNFLNNDHDDRPIPSPSQLLGEWQRHVSYVSIVLLGITLPWPVLRFLLSIHHPNPRNPNLGQTRSLCPCKGSHWRQL